MGTRERSKLYKIVKGSSVFGFVYSKQNIQQEQLVPGDSEPVVSGFEKDSWSDLVYYTIVSFIHVHWFP